MGLLQLYSDTFITVMSSALFAAFLPYVLGVSVKMLDKLL